MVFLHVVPVAARRRMVEPVDVLLPSFPACGGKMVLALPGVGEHVRVLDRRDQVLAQITQIAFGDLRAASELDLRDRRALVELVVADLFEVLRAQVVMKELVPVVVLVVANVRIEEVEVGEERGDREHDRDPALRLHGDALAQLGGAQLVHEQQGGRHRQKDARALHVTLPVGFLEERILPKKVLARGKRHDVAKRRIQRGKQGHHDQRSTLERGSLSGGLAGNGARPQAAHSVGATF